MAGVNARRENSDRCRPLKLIPSQICHSSACSTQACTSRVTADGVQTFEPIAQFDAVQNAFAFLPIDFGPDLGADSDQLFLILFGTGWRARTSLASASLLIGTTNVPVIYAGAQGGFEGLDQINAQLPRSLADLTLTIDGKVANIVQASFK